MQGRIWVTFIEVLQNWLFLFFVCLLLIVMSSGPIGHIGVVLLGYMIHLFLVFWGFLFTEWLVELVIPLSLNEGSSFTPQVFAVCCFVDLCLSYWCKGGISQLFWLSSPSMLGMLNCFWDVFLTHLFSSFKNSLFRSQAWFLNGHLFLKSMSSL